MEKLTWEVRNVNLSDLTPLENNPFGKVTEEKRKRLRESLQRLGDFQICTVDTDMVLLTANKRFFALKELGETETQVKFPSRKLSNEERKEIIVSSNLHEGDWIAEVLREEYGDMDLAGMGLDNDFLKDFVFNDPPIELPGKDPFDDTGITGKNQYGVIVMCANEAEQEHIFIRLTGEGFNCKIVVT